MEVIMFNLNDQLSWLAFSVYSLKEISEDDNLTNTQKTMLDANANIIEDILKELQVVNRKIIEQQQDK